MKRVFLLLIFGVPVALALGWLWKLDGWPTLPRIKLQVVHPDPAPTPDLPIATDLRDAPSNVPSAMVKSDALSEFRTDLRAGRYEQAMERYLQTYRGTDAQSSETWRQVILQTASQLLQDKQLNSGLELLNSYLAFFYKDVSALALAASAQHGLNRHGEEVELLLQAHQQAHRGNDRQVLRRRLQQAVSEQGRWLERKGRPAAAISFYKTLVERDPIEPSYRIALARLYLNKRDPRQALDHLESLDKVYAGDQQNSIVKMRERARRMLNQDQAQRTSVPLLTRGHGSAVRALINGTHTVTLLIDTGATLVALRPDVAQRIGLPTTHNNVLFHTANGSVRASIVRIRELKVGAHAVNELSAGVLPISNAQYDGLLGMNYLSQFRFQIDQQRRVLLLNERTTRDRP